MKFFLLAVLLFVVCYSTPLDDYVNAPDPYQSYKLIDVISGPGYYAYMLNVTSQKWLDEKQVNNPIWWHYLAVCVPDDLRNVSTSLVYIDGYKDNTDPPPTSLYIAVEVLCLSARIVTAHLMQIPNQPLIFNNDGVKRSEDGLIAYGWRRFLNESGSNPQWLARLPMTKATVVAMNAIQNFTNGLASVKTKIKTFIVAGASKRGWTTWTTGIVDTRVIAIIPMVIPVLNMAPQFLHQYQAYGNFSFAVGDYKSEGITDFLETDDFLNLAKIVDPLYYLSRQRVIDMPKYLICATGDEFFMPDSPSFFWDKIQGEKHLYMAPNAEHSLASALPNVIENISTFVQMVTNSQQRPNFTWSLQRSNTSSASITITLDPSNVLKPYAVKMWHARTLSDTKRDFRLLTCYDFQKCFQPVLWFEKKLVPEANDSNVYIATAEKPVSGWRGFMVEVTFKLSDNPLSEYFIKFSSEVNIVPDTVPYPAYIPFPPLIPPTNSSNNFNNNVLNKRK
eukprot:TRINITY_DN920_c0_g2_i1.p1 TRINITY_DN920_c0_g2~~TRINITY_DN920_c0_g2_i1.p1  ORF type:complete len:505 (+),score=132.03 TRINITY_DN920_c0_g2_i1:1-1515(+)